MTGHMDGSVLKDDSAAVVVHRRPGPQLLVPAHSRRMRRRPARMYSDSARRVQEEIPNSGYGYYGAPREIPPCGRPRDLWKTRGRRRVLWKAPRRTACFPRPRGLRPRPSLRRPHAEPNTAPMRRRAGARRTARTGLRPARSTGHQLFTSGP